MIGILHQKIGSTFKGVAYTSLSFLPKRKVTLMVCGESSPIRLIANLTFAILFLHLIDYRVQSYEKFPCSAFVPLKVCF